MKVKVYENSQELGRAAAKHAASVLNERIAKGEMPRIILSTGASQFTFFEHFVKEDVDWSKVEMFHLDRIL